MSIETLKANRQFWLNTIAEAEKITPFPPLRFYVALSRASSQLRIAQMKAMIAGDK